MRVCNLNSSGTLYSGFLDEIFPDDSSLENKFLEDTSSDCDASDVDFPGNSSLCEDTSDCKLAVLIQVRCTNGSSFVYNINPLSCHGIALIYTIARKGDFDKWAIS